MKLLLKCALLGTSFLTVGAAISYAATDSKYDAPSSKYHHSSSESIEEKERKERLLGLKTGLMSLSELEGSLDVDVSYADYNVKLDLITKLDFQKLNYFALDGLVSYKDKFIDLGAKYLDDTLYLDTYDGKFKVSNVSFDTIFEALNQNGFDEEIPSELKDLKLQDLFEILDSFLVRSEPTSYTYYLDTDEFEFSLVTDTTYKLTKIELSNLVIDDVKINLAYESKITNLNYEVNNENYIEMLEVRPLVEKMSNIIDSKTFNLDLDLNLNTNGQVIDLKGESSVDISRELYDFNFDVTHKETLTKLGFTYTSEASYAALNSYLKAKISHVELNKLINKFNSNLSFDEEKGKDFLNKLNELDIIRDLRNEEYERIVDLIKNITTTSSTIRVDLNLNEFNLVYDSFAIILDISNPNFLSLEFENITFDDLILSGSVSLKDFTPFEKDLASYNDFSFINGLVDQVGALVNQDKFALDLDILVEGEGTDLQLLGSTQFDITKKDGSGNLIVRQVFNNGETFDHNIYVDFIENNEIYFSYNDLLNGKTTASDLGELVEELENLLNKFNDQDNPNEFDIFKSLKNLLDGIDTSLFLDLIRDGNYTKLLSDEYIKRFEYVDGILYFKVAKELFSLSDDLELELLLVDDKLESLKIVDFNINNNVINASIKIKDYDENATHLLPKEDVVYIDFKDVSKLVNCAINTLDSKYYHLNGSVGLGFKILIDIKMDIKFDAYLDFSEANDTKMLFNFDVPALTGVNISEGTNHKIKSSIYYTKDFVYIERVDDYELIKTTMNGWIPQITKENKTVRVNKKYSEKYFTTNIVEILLKDVLGINQSMIDQLLKNNQQTPVVEGEEEETNNKLDFSKILKDFSYEGNEDQSGKFNILINLGELIKNDMLGEVNLQISHNSENLISNVTLVTKLSTALPINLTLNCDLLDHGMPWSEDTLSVYNNYINEHLNDALDDASETEVA